MKRRVVRLGQVVEINPSTKATGAADDLVAFLAMADISEEGQVASIQQRPLAEVQKGYTIFRPGDVLLAKITPCFENGKAAFVESLPTQVGFGSTEFHVLRPTEEVDPKFLFHLIRSPNFRRLGASRMTGSAGQRRVPVAFLSDFEFSLPSLQEQRRITTILDKADSLRRKRQESTRLADEFVQSLFFTTFGDVDTNTHCWDVCRLEDLALQVTDGEHQTPRRSADGVKLLSARNVQNGFLALTDVDYVPADEFERIRRRCEPRRGDILISCSGTIGRVTAVSTDEPMALVRSVALVRPNTRRVLTTFLEHYLRSATMQRRMAAASKSSAQANLFQGPIRALPVLLPPMSLQVDFEKRLLSMQSWSRKAADSAGMILDLGKSLQSKYLVSEAAL